ncbi:MAG: glycosyl transferase [Rhodospirillales bacterium]|nr:glycosyl transferase [Rhodospirillales bacterium]
MWRGVYAVIYTYNRKELLTQCLASVQAQMVSPERIILIDNGCSDGTQEYLAARGMLDDARIEYVRLEKNTGAAGGVRAGISHAFRLGCAWAWVMDDDVVCEPGTLQGLKDAFEANFRDMSEVGFLVSRLIGGDGRANNVPTVDDRRDEHDVCNDWTEFLARGLVKVRIATLTSVLLPRTTLVECGTPRGDFFIWGEDSDYTLRITNWRPGYLVGGSRALHLRGVAGELDIFNESDPRRLDYFYYLYRNTTYLRRTYWPLRGLCLFLGKAALQLCRSLGQKQHRWKRAHAIAAGVAAGLFFRPRPEPLASSGELSLAVAGAPNLPDVSKIAAAPCADRLTRDLRRA